MLAEAPPPVEAPLREPPPPAYDATFDDDDATRTAAVMATVRAALRAERASSTTDGRSARDSLATSLRRPTSARSRRARYARPSGDLAVARRFKRTTSAFL